MRGLSGRFARPLVAGVVALAAAAGAPASASLALPASQSSAAAAGAVEPRATGPEVPAPGAAAASLPAAEVPQDCGSLQAVVVDDEVIGCTHGPDPAPPGVDPRVPVPLEARSSDPQQATAAAVAPPRVPCYGDGVEGNRVQAVYAYPADRPDRYAQVAPSISRWAAEMDQVFDVSAGQTGGSRHVRFVTDSSCELVIQKVRLSALGDDTFTTTMAEMRAQGFTRNDRKYLVWMDSTVLCGVAGYYLDDRPTADNLNNGTAPGMVARVDSGCWGLASEGQSVEAHEVVHALGAVQPSAPHSSELGHCDDEADRMCYADGSPGLVLRRVCPTTNEPYLDCNHDDYYSTNPAPGSYLATHWNTGRSSFLATSDPVTTAPPPAPAPASPSPSASPTTPLEPLLDPILPDPPAGPADSVVGNAGSRFRALPPSRVADTRTGNGGRTGRLGPGEAFDVQVAGRGGVPAEGASGVVLNVTVTQGTQGSALTAFPTGDAQPDEPNVRFAAGATRPSLVVVPLGDGGRVRFANRSGSTHVVADVVGLFGEDRQVATSRFSSLAPARILDTRTGNGAPRAPLRGPGTLRLQVTGRGGVPTAGVEGVFLNVTATNATASSYLTLYPTGGARPLASNLNFVRNETVPNLVLVPVGSGGRVDVFSSTGAVHVVADVVGWLDNGSESAQSDFAPLSPAPVLDTRNGTGGFTGPIGDGQTATFDVVGQGGVPSSGVAGVVLNVSALGPTRPGFLTTFPAGATRPLASNLNFVTGQSTANLVVVPVGTDGRVSVYNDAGATHVRADVVGYLDAG